MSRRTAAVAITLALSASLQSLPARAEGSADKAAAEALFDEGRKLLAAKKYQEACPKFEASQKLDPGVGTMLNLADCFEKNGQTASAWATFREAISAARDAGSKDREDTARARARALEPQLARLTIASPKGQAVSVTRDGTPIDSAMLGTPVPVDPGGHVIAVTAPGKRKWSTTVNVGTGAQVAVDVPILTDEPAAAAVPAPTPAQAGASSSASASASSSGKGGSTQRTVAIVAGTVGIAGIAVGTIFGLKASSKWSDAKGHCTAYPYGCGPDGVALRDDATQAGNLSTVGFVVGALGVAGGAVLWLTAPKSSGEGGVSIVIGPGSAFAQGRF